MESLERELGELVDEVTPPLIDMEQLERLVTQDEAAELFDGECFIHDGCQSIGRRQL
jgi:hypothetical protein